jgi:hypothetical protein
MDRRAKETFLFAADPNWFPWIPAIAAGPMVLSSKALEGGGIEGTGEVD